MEIRTHTICSVCEAFVLSNYAMCSIRCWNLGTERGTWHRKRACFCTEQIFEYFQSNFKHYGVRWNRTLSIVCPHCCQSCEMLVESSNNVSRKLVRKALSMDSTGKENWTTWIRTYLCSHGVSPVWLHQGTGDTDIWSHISYLIWKQNYLKCRHKPDKRMFTLAKDMTCIRIQKKKGKKQQHLIMTETYLVVQEQKYARDVYAVLDWVLSDCCATKIDTTKTICYAHCVNQHLKMKFISWSRVHHMQTSDHNLFQPTIVQPV